MNRVIISLLSIIIVSCNSIALTENRTSLRAQLIYSSQQCNRSERSHSAILISDDQRYNLIFKRLNRHIIGSSEVVPPLIDFSKYIVLLLELGQRNTAGYEIRLADEDISLIDGVVHLGIVKDRPDPRKMTAMVITSPCIMIKLQIADYSLIRILDQQNELFIEIAARKK